MYAELNSILKLLHLGQADLDFSYKNDVTVGYKVTNDL